MAYGAWPTTEPVMLLWLSMHRGWSGVKNRGAPLEHSLGSAKACSSILQG